MIRKGLLLVVVLAIFPMQEASARSCFLFFCWPTRNYHLHVHHHRQASHARHARPKHSHYQHRARSHANKAPALDVPAESPHNPALLNTRPLPLMK